MLQLKISKETYTYLAAVIFAFLILFATWNGIFGALALLLGVLIVIFCQKDVTLSLFAFIAPMATIFKMGPTSQSCYTYLLLFFVLWQFFVNRRVPLKIISIGLFCCYLIIVQIFNNSLAINGTIKFVANFCLLMWVDKEYVSSSRFRILNFFVLGVITSSIFGLLDSDFFKISEFVKIDQDGVLFQGSRLYRFTGVAADPNFYSVNVILSLCILVYLYYYDRIKISYMVIAGAGLFYFALLTYSKSAALMLALPTILIVWVFIKKRNYICVILIVILVLLVLSGRVSAFDVIIDRLKSGGLNLSSLTTGRDVLWKAYVDEFVNNLILTIFGHGIGSALLLGGISPHNTYIDAIYYLGLVGTVWFASLLFIKPAKREKRITFVSMSGYICIIIMYFFLSELLYYDLPMHLFLSNLLLDGENDTKMIVSA